MKMQKSSIEPAPARAKFYILLFKIQKASYEHLQPDEVFEAVLAGSEVIQQVRQ